MARVTGPLFSQEARGQFGRSVVFTRRRGQNIARGYVIPANPQTPGQITVRIGLATSGLVTRRVRATDWEYATESQTWIEFWRTRTRTGEVWNSAYGREVMGPGFATYNASRLLYADQTDPVQLLWQNAAETAIAGLADYTRGDVTISAGELLFIAERGISLAGYGETFDAESPVAIASGS